MRALRSTLVAALCLFASGTAAGDELWRLEEVTVPPAEAETWERAWRAALDDLGPVSTLVDEASRYFFLAPAVDPAGGSTGTAGTAAAADIGGEHLRSWLLAPEPALSRPGSATLDPPAFFVRFRLLFVDPDRTAQATDALEAIGRRIDRLEQPPVYRVYRALSGPDLPLLVVVSAARSAPDWYARHAETEAALGEEGRALERRLRRGLRRLESHQGRTVPGLSTRSSAPSDWAVFTGRAAASLAVPAEPLPSREATASAGTPIVDAARAWIARAPVYDPAYRELAFPGGDPGPGVGTGADLVVRALRGIGLDLQQAIFDDIGTDPGAYGQEPGGRDTDIDHRRIRNLRTWLDRHAERLGTGIEADWRAGDLVFWDTVGDGRADHAGIISDRRTAAGVPFVIHHFPARAPFTGTPREESVFDLWPRLDHFRIRAPEILPPSP